MEEKLFQIIESNTGIRIFEIQEQLDIERSELIQILESSKEYVQDSSYRWHLNNSDFSDHDDQAKSSTKDKNDELADIANYYLSCLGYEDAKNVDFWAESKWDKYDYFELDSLNDIEGDWTSNAAYREATSRNNSERYKKQLYLAYPLNLVIFPSGAKKIEPLFLVPFEGGELNDLFASINESVFKKYSHGSVLEVSSEIRETTDELKLGDMNVIPRIDEIVPKFYDLKHEWNWQEKIDVNNLSSGNIRDCDAAGLYNKAAIVLIEKSKFTMGLTYELGTIQKSSSKTKNALNDWLSKSFSNKKDSDKEPIIEPLEMNLEQREAVKSSLNKKLTVITGPPGTGKSQVVTNILVNASLRGKRVLFASRNNKAVDVVHARANGICEKEFVNRLGNAYESNLSAQMNKILSVQGNKQEILEEFKSIENSYKQLVSDKEKITKKLDDSRKTRNLLSKKDKDFKDIIEVFGDKSLNLLQKNKSDIDQLLDDFEKKLFLSKKENHNFFIQLLWTFFEAEKIKEKKESKNILNKLLKKIDTPEIIYEKFKKEKLSDFKSDLKAVERYKKLKKGRKKELDKLRDIDVVDLQKNLLENQKQISNISANYWNAWLKRLPFKITKEQKDAIGEAASLLDVITQGREDPKNRRVSKEMREYVKMFPKISKVLSAWAVSSLSVRNRIPFESSFFDLLVIDEASQCDIASAIPLLYRAKNVVVIGDSNQLKHITSVSSATNKVLMDRYKLIEEGKVNWNYSSNSLFDLASRICPSESLIMLRDHHRSRSEIINFSNKHFYDGQLRIATDYKKLNIPSRDEPALRWLDVQGQVVQPSNSGAINDNEVKAVVKEIKRLVIEQNYSGTIGVVTPFTKQAKRIDEAVKRDDSLSFRLPQINFLCNTVHSFQGDERDIIIFSTVINEEAKDTLKNFLKSSPHLFNVALTRARSSLVMVGDRYFARNCSINYLKSFSEYIDQVNKEKDNIAQQAESGELISDSSVIISDYEKQFFKLMQKNNLKPYTQYPVDKYRLDFAFIKGDKKLNIEIDGEEYHKSWTGDRLRSDIIRNHRLIEDGWDVMRIWVYELEEYSEEYIERIKKYLAD